MITTAPQTLSDSLDLAGIISGLAGDLAQRRAGQISIEDARVRAELARQLLGAIRVMITAQKMIDAQMKQVGALPAPRSKKRT